LKHFVGARAVISFSRMFKTVLKMVEVRVKAELGKVTRLKENERVCWGPADKLKERKNATA
jgi:hypothetical protein